MNNKIVAHIGILGVSLFGLAAIIGPLLIEDYSVVGQYISESFASNTEYGRYLQYFGYVPSGILTTIFCLNAFKYLPSSKLVTAGFIGLAIFYGMGTILVGLFPCDEGCNVELIDPSVAQLIHNAVAALTYIFVPISIIGIGLGLKRAVDIGRLSQIAITVGIVSLVCIFMLFSDTQSAYRGLLQRIIEASFIFWIITCAINIKKGGYKNI